MSPKGRGGGTEEGTARLGLCSLCRAPCKGTAFRSSRKGPGLQDTRTRHLSRTVTDGSPLSDAPRREGGALRAGTHRGRVVLGCGPGCWGASRGWPRPSVQGTKRSCTEPPLLPIPTQELGGACSNTSPRNQPRHVTAVRTLVALSLRSAQMLIHTYWVFHINSIILCLSLCWSDNTVWPTLTATPLPGGRDSLA